MAKAPKAIGGKLKKSPTINPLALEDAQGIVSEILGKPKKGKAIGSVILNKKVNTNNQVI